VTISIIAISQRWRSLRFITLQTQARIAKTQALYGGLRSAAVLAHAQAITTNTVTTGPAIISMEAQNVTLINGYPTADLAGIQTALQISNLTEDVTITPGGAAAGATFIVAVNGGTVPNCQVTYASPIVGNGSPLISVTTTGC